MSIHTTTASLANTLTASVSVRFVVVGALFLLSMIPLALVGSVVGDREAYFDEAIDGIEQSWAGSQRLAGPMLLIPRLDEDGGDAGHVALMPETLDLHVESRHETRQRGIFEAPVFHLDASAEGAFPALDAASLQTRFGPLRMDQATLAMGVSDPRGIRDAEFTWLDGSLALSAHSTGPIGGMLTGLPAAVAPGGKFSIRLALRGSGRFSAVPVGDQSSVAMASTWPHPSFDGRILPDVHDVRSDGFTASWVTHQLGRGFASALHIPAGEWHLFEDMNLGFSVFEPVNLYGSVLRSVKYGVLFVVLTLAGLLCIELSMGLRFHYVQYGVTAVALVLFFLTLLALAEHVGFTLGYSIAAALLTGMIGWYIHGSTESRSLTALGMGVLAVLYAVLYGLVRLESFALLAGTGVLLLALAMLMWATRKLAATALSEP